MCPKKSGMRDGTFNLIFLFYAYVFSCLQPLDGSLLYFDNQWIVFTMLMRATHTGVCTDKQINIIVVLQFGEGVTLLSFTGACQRIIEEQFFNSSP